MFGTNQYLKKKKEEEEERRDKFSISDAYFNYVYYKQLRILSDIPTKLWALVKWKEIKVGHSLTTGQHALTKNCLPN